MGVADSYSTPQDATDSSSHLLGASIRKTAKSVHARLGLGWWGATLQIGAMQIILTRYSRP